LTRGRAAKVLVVIRHPIHRHWPSPQDHKPDNP
jgi:hypothetical protein